MRTAKPLVLMQILLRRFGSQEPIIAEIASQGNLRQWTMSLWLTTNDENSIFEGELPTVVVAFTKGYSPLPTSNRRALPQALDYALAVDYVRPIREHLRRRLALRSIRLFSGRGIHTRRDARDAQRSPHGDRRR